MSESTAVPDAVPSSRDLSKAVAGAGCALVGALALCHCADQLFFFLPQMSDIWAAVGVKTTWTTDFVLRHGLALWLVLAVGTVGSLVLAFRKPCSSKALVVNVGMLMLSLAFAYLVNQGAWNSSINLFLDLLDPAREIPRRN